FKTVPALDQPLRALVGAYAGLLRERQRAAAGAGGAVFVDIAALASPRFLDRPESMSPDGFHPSAVGYGFWADALAPAVAAAVSGR
ncbi:MAG: SGNH/GDSL hydrolase family protein, partial [Actinomycetota bacterium]|nr:SGNH/GDSL hydrolase family protein [Actinomycetota bacterium]